MLINLSPAVITSIFTILLLQAVWIIYLCRRRPSPSHASDDSEASIRYQSLSKTKQQLYREIARHEATEDLLEETEKYLNAIISCMPTALIGVTPAGYVTHWNRAAEANTHISAKQAIGQRLDDVHSDLPITLELIGDTLQNNKPLAMENIQREEGSEIIYSNITIYPLTSEDIAGAVILIDDVTRNVQVEQMMIQNEKMVNLGELAAGLAHELNNPLAAILNNVQNFKRRAFADLEANQRTAEEVGIDLAKVQEYLNSRNIPTFVDGIRDAGERAANIVTSMLEFSRSNITSHTLTDMSELLEHSLLLATRTFELKTSEGIETPQILREFEEDIPKVLCSPPEIQQVILNLLRNAAQAFRLDEYGPPLEPKITLRIKRKEDRVLLEVEDNGPGIPESVQAHIFEPFFTTKDVGQGTGLGLAVSYFIITKHHNGSIQVKSKPGEGTTFTIALPLE